MCVRRGALGNVKKRGWAGKEMTGGKSSEKKKGRRKMIGKDYSIF